MNVYRRVLFPVYFLLSAIVYLYTADYADNPDSFQYLSIARQYSEGHLPVNGYWSPLISWLLILPLKILNDGVLAFKVIQVLIGAMALYQWVKWTGRFKSTDHPLIQYFPIPFLIFYGQFNLTPDLLFLALLLYLLNLSFTEKPNRMYLTGLTGGLLYLTKAFGLPFFIAWMIGTTIMQRHSISFIGKVLVALLFTILPWIAALLFQYDRPVISLAGSFNRSEDVAPLPGRAAALPILRGGIYEPKEGALSAWETPGDYVSKKQITIWSDPRSFFAVVKRNLSTIWYYDFQRQMGLIFILLLIHALLFHRHLFSRREVQLSLFMILLVYGGYSLILVHTRYVWICYWLMFFFGVTLIREIRSIGKDLRQAVVVLLLIFAWKRPVKQIFFAEDTDVPLFWLGKALQHPILTLELNYRHDKELAASIKKLKPYQPEGKLIAVRNLHPDRDLYTEGLRIAFEHRLIFLGVTDEEVATRRSGAGLIMSHQPLRSSTYFGQIPTSHFFLYTVD